MEKNVEGKYKVTVYLPDELLMPVWQKYARVGRDNTDDDALTRNYKQALEVIEGGTYSGPDGEEHSLKDTPIEKVPPAVVAWVGATVTVWTAEQFAIEKN